MAPDLRPGDRVRIVGEHRYGETGTVTRIGPAYGENVSVQMDRGDRRVRERYYPVELERLDA